MFDDLIPGNKKSRDLSFDDLIPTAPVRAEDVRDATGVPGGVSAPAPTPEPQGVQGILANLSLGTQNVGRGLSDAIFGVGDIANGAVNLGLDGLGALGVPVPESRLSMPSDNIAGLSGQLYEKAGGTIYNDEDLSASQRVIGDAVRFGTAGLTGGAGLAKAATKNTAIPKSLTQPYAVNPARTVAGDTAAGFGAGVGSGAYEEAVPEEQQGPLGQLFAALLGGVGGSTLASVGEGLGRASVSSVKKAVTGDVDAKAPINPDTGRPYSKNEVRQAAAVVQADASNPKVAARNIQDATAEYDQYAPRGARPTVGAISDDVGLAMREGTERTRDAKPFVERDRNVQSFARSRIADSVDPNADGRNFTDFAERTTDGRMADVEVQTAQARDAMGQRGAPENPLADVQGKKLEASQNIDKKFRDTLDTETARKNELYQNPALNEAPVDPQRIYDAANAIEDSLGRVGDPNSVPSGIIQRIKSLETLDPDTGDVVGLEGITYGDVLDLRAQVSDEIGKARAASGAGASGSGPLVSNLTRLRKELDGYIDDLAASDDPAIAQAAKDASTNFKENFGPRFRDGQAGAFTRDVKADKFGTRTRPSDTAGRFLNNKPEDVKSLRRAVADDGDTVANMRTYLLDDLASSGGLDAKTGRLKPDRVRAWAAKNDQNIENVPGLKAKVDELLGQATKGETLDAKFADEVRALEASATAQRRKIGQSALSKVSGKDPVNAMKTVFSSGDPERAIKEIIAETGGDTKAREGVKAAMRDYLLDTTATTALQKTTDGTPPVSFAALEKTFRKHEKVLAEAYSPEEMNSLRQAHKLLEPLGKLALRGTSGSDTAEKSKRMFRALEAGLKARYGVLKGGGILRTIRVAAEALPNSKGAVDGLVQQMMFDPDLAVHLLSKDVADRVNTPSWNAKLNRLLAYRSAAEETENDDGE